jgi:type III pantothenate kinase
VKVLALDIGNSKIAAGLVEGDTLVDGVQEALPVHATPSLPLAPHVARVYDWCTHQLILEEREAPIEAIAIASVVPAALEIWRHLWEGKEATRNRPSLVVDAAVPLPFDIEIQSPETVGADRLCNVARVVALGHDRAILVDLGTANTFDVLWEGAFRGGLIAPGCAAAHYALVRAGAQLPEIPFARPERMVGRHTVEAMQAGSFYQSLGGIVHIVGSLLGEFPGCPVILTGGMAELMAPEMPIDVLYYPDLTLEGAVAIWRYQQRSA